MLWYAAALCVHAYYSAVTLGDHSHHMGWPDRLSRLSLTTSPVRGVWAGLPALVSGVTGSSAGSDYSNESVPKITAKEGGLPPPIGGPLLEPALQSWRAPFSRFTRRPASVLR